MPSGALVLTSARNPLLKDIRRAVARGALTDGGFAVAEGFHLFDETLRSGLDIGCVLVTASRRAELEQRLRSTPDLRLVVIDDALLSEISSTENSQGVITLVKPRQRTLDSLFCGVPLLVVLDGVQDPGNAGAIVRAAEAFGASGAIFLQGTVSPYNPKALRASAGSLFRIPMIQGIDGASIREELDRRALQMFVATAQGENAVCDIDLTGPFALIMGSEGCGVSEHFRSGASSLWIPTMAVESLNVAMAAGIILYEARRQRRLLP